MSIILTFKIIKYSSGEFALKPAYTDYVYLLKRNLVIGMKHHKNVHPLSAETNSAEHAM